MDDTEDMTVEHLEEMIRSLKREKSARDKALRKTARADGHAAAAKAFAARIHRLRIARGLSKYAVTKATGLNPASLVGFEKGTRLPGFVSLIALSEALDVSLDFLMRGEAEDA